MDEILGIVDISLYKYQQFKNKTQITFIYPDITNLLIKKDLIALNSNELNKYKNFKTKGNHLQQI